MEQIPKELGRKIATTYQWLLKDLDAGSLLTKIEREKDRVYLLLPGFIAIKILERTSKPCNTDGLYPEREIIAQAALKAVIDGGYTGVLNQAGKIPRPIVIRK